MTFLRDAKSPAVKRDTVKRPALLEFMTKDWKPVRRAPEVPSSREGFPRPARGALEALPHLGPGHPHRPRAGARQRLPLPLPRGQVTLSYQVRCVR
jgi:hypothetical protein